MKVSYNWLNHYLHSHTEKNGSKTYKLPSPEKIAKLLIFNAFEVESIEKVGNDFVFDVKILPNRSHDCFSHKGIAREIARLLNKTIYSEKFTDYKVTSKKEVYIDIREPKLCSRYMGVVVEGIKIGPSPDWLKERLLSIGQRSINNIVDITNFIMFEIGQPIHAFDADKLTEKKGNPHIVVRNARDGEKMNLLDGKEIALNSKMLIIADSDKALAIAGVKGGKIAEISDTTKNIVIESANFEPVQVRKTSRALGIRTDSSARFEHGISPVLAEEGIRLAIEIMLEIASDKNTKIGSISDSYPKKCQPYKLGVSSYEANKLLGTKLKDKDIARILTQLHLPFEKINPLKQVLKLAPEFAGVPYKYGASVSYDAPGAFDCSSFVSYIYAQAGIGLPRMTPDQYSYTEEIKGNPKPGDIVFSNTGEGKIYYESIEFMSGKVKTGNGVDHEGIYLGEGKVIHSTRKKGKVVIENLKESESFKNITGIRRVILSKDPRFVVTVPPERLDLMSTRSFLTSGIKEDLIEEIGRAYGYKKIKGVMPKQIKQKEINREFYYADKIREILAKEEFSEVMTYTFRSQGEIEVENPLASDKKFLRSSLGDGLSDSFALNSSTLPLLGISNIKQEKIFEIGKVFKKNKEFTQLGLAVDGQSIANSAKDALSRALKVEINGETKGNIFLIDFDALLEKLPEPKQEKISTKAKKQIRYKHISQYPFALRDIAVFTPAKIKSNAVLEIIEKEAGILLVQKKLFDVFEKTHTDGTKKVSYAFNLVFQSDEHTFSDGEINKIMDNITGALNSKNGWQVR
ncbi:MAG: phenylalanine--tRNA ligase beta subunit-related protein [Patescibacteria group bacterium]